MSSWIRLESSLFSRLRRTLRVVGLFVFGGVLALSGCGSGSPGSTVSEVEPGPLMTEAVSDTSAPTESAAPADESTIVAPVVDAAPRSTSLASEGERTLWTGSISDTIAVSVWLAQQGEFVRGELTYDSVGEPIMVLGRSYLDDEGYFLQELGTDGRVSGYLTLGISVDGVVKGTWGDQSLELELAGVGDLPYFFDPLVRPGKYAFSHSPFGEDGEECCGPTGAMTLSGVEDDSITVAFDNVTGGPGFNLAVIEPTDIALDNNRAVFETTEDGLDCAFEILVFDGFAYVDPIDNRFDCGFGNAASVVGFYVLV